MKNKENFKRKEQEEFRVSCMLKRILILRRSMIIRKNLSNANEVLKTFKRKRIDIITFKSKTKKIESKI